MIINTKQKVISKEYLLPLPFKHPFAAQRSLFKAYDIRGNRTLFTDKFVTALSTVFYDQFFKTIATYNKNKLTVVIGYDPRHGSQAIAEIFANTLINKDVQVVWLGLVTTPIMVYWASKYDGHGLIATASHSAKHINGLKWVIDGESPSSDEIRQLYAPLKHSKKQSNTQILSASTLYTNDNLIRLSADELIQSYINSVDAAINNILLVNPVGKLPSMSSARTRPPRPLKVVIDCLNGATGPFAKPFFSHHALLCADVIVLNAVPNADFPKGNPDPTEASRLHELQRAVISHAADIGLAFDGDGDRLTVVDDTGKTIAADHLIYLLACVAIDGVSNSASQLATHYPHSTKQPSPIQQPLNNSPLSTNSPNPTTVIFDIKCSHHLPILIQKINATPLMIKTGSSIMRKTLQGANSQAIFAGELSGHFLFNDGHFILHDDAMYAAIRLIHWLCHQPQHSPLSAIIASLPVMVSTDDIYLSLDEYQADGIDDVSLLNQLLCLRQQLCTCCDVHPKAHELNQQICHTLSDTIEPTQAAVISQCAKFGLPEDSRLTCIDGIRLDFESGFGVIRPSNTSNCLTVRFAGDTLADLQNIKRHFVNLCQPINSQLAHQIANITVTA